MNTKKIILIPGATGTVGSEVVKQLVEKIVVRSHKQKH